MPGLRLGPPKIELTAAGRITPRLNNATPPFLRSHSITPAHPTRSAPTMFATRGGHGTPRCANSETPTLDVESSAYKPTRAQMIAAMRRRNGGGWRRNVGAIVMP
jgi:hypothetical protein